ncbi:MAG: multifunctional CCA tRNA nucleotidyl transferase/2'3'-cyclic phosphodiesterase/2'nucleotidase/phosphatase [Gallionellales bacterium GWA2_60_142]|nr:MAG: multifunctional CCA tRNA nucleotidyl transferase/2'3'-cyclic phosphodiesterase/2'nucleotidase/phosphatase [Gallionellales bacterium GWA2_60_142]HCI15147.1 multifunctional CCA addition/repair protein [Gallionellaceae bacterium]
MRSEPEIYCVGGAVRDRLLGLPVQDHDWVVVGSTPEQMEAMGYRPVGKDFPVFLHPKTHEEYALARTERKTAPGYKGFAIHASPEVTLEEDLLRRDFTINAIAEDNDGKLIDPHNGIADLHAGILRHVSDAFAEDPVRILRGARFAARFGFSFAPETLALMRRMVDNGEVDALVAERVWQELARGLMEQTPSRFFETLRDCGALARILPEVDALFGVPQRADYHPEIDCGIHTMMVIDDAARHGYALEVRYAALTHDLGKATTPADILPRHIGHEQRSFDLLKILCERLRAPADCRDLALLVAQYHSHAHKAFELRPETVFRLFQSTDVWRKPERFGQLLLACASDARGRTGHEQDTYPQADYLLQLMHEARAVDAGKIAAGCEDKATIPDRVRQARIVAIESAVNNHRQTKGQ